MPIDPSESSARVVVPSTSASDRHDRRVRSEAAPQAPSAPVVFELSETARALTEGAVEAPSAPATGADTYNVALARAAAAAAPPPEDRALRELEDRDVEVRSQARLQASAAVSSAVDTAIQYEQGPDGRKFAVDVRLEVDSSTPQSEDAAEDKARALRVAAGMQTSDGGSAAELLTEAQRLEAELKRREASRERAAAAFSALSKPD